MNAEILQVKDLRVYYHTDSGLIRAVDGVTFSLSKGKRLGLVGESGSGKSTTALALMRLLNPPGRIESGEILLGDVQVTKLSDEEMRRVRFSRISLIPQGAMNSLNPVDANSRAILRYDGCPQPESCRREKEKRVEELTSEVGLRGEVGRMYPHELSGGMKQRVCIALAITLQPALIIADEPTSALDVVVQRQVMETLGRVESALGAAVILVGHDMGLMAQFVDHLGVMYAGKLVEIGPCGVYFSGTAAPLHSDVDSESPISRGQASFQRNTRSLAIPTQSASRLFVSPTLPFGNSTLLG